MEEMVPREVDSWRFAGNFLKNALSANIPAEPAYDGIPWTPLAKPLAECRVALLSTAGLSMKGDAPFDMEMERKNPMRGDPSWRALPATATAAGTCANHLHIDTGYVLRDLNVALPVDRLRELAEQGVIGSVADTSLLDHGLPGQRLRAPWSRRARTAIAAAMRSEEVDLALLAPV